MALLLTAFLSGGMLLFSFGFAACVASLEDARQALNAWFRYYNEQRPHQALNMKTPRQMYQLAA